MGRHSKPRDTKRQLRRFGTATAISATSAAAMFAAQPSASAVTPTAQTMDDVPSAVSKDSSVTFAGTLTGIGDRPLADQEVDLQRKVGSNWYAVDTSTTNSEGRVSIAAAVERTADYRLVYGGDTVRDRSGSPAQEVQVRTPINDRIVEHAAAQRGKPYSYGASGPDSFDCSGLTQYVHDKVGIDLPRTSGEQASSVDSIPKSDRRPGDLLFFSDGGSVYHVGIYAGDGKMWHAPNAGSHVELADIWTNDYSVGRAW